MRHSSHSLTKVPWFRQNQKLIYCTALLFICNVFSLMILFQTIDEKSNCNDDIEITFQHFVEPGTGGYHPPKSNTNTKRYNKYHNDNNLKLTNNNDNSNNNNNNNNNDVNSNQKSIQSQLDTLTDINLMPFQRYKQVNLIQRQNNVNYMYENNYNYNNDDNNEMRKDNEIIASKNANTNKNSNDKTGTNSKKELYLASSETNSGDFDASYKSYSLDSNTDLKEYVIASPFELGFHRQCSQLHFASQRFLNIIKMFEYQRDRSYFLNYHCPNPYKIEFRPNGLTPHVLGNECAPGWPADIIYILSRLLNKNMIAIQYGIGVSNIWVSLYVDQLYAVDTRGDHYEDFNKKIEKTDLDLSNAHIQFMRMSKKYVQQVDPSRGKVVDLIVMETVPSFHADIIKYAVSVLKPNNGILVLRYDWYTPEYIEENITKIIPPTWRRYNSYIPPKFVEEVPFSQERYIENAKSTMWITSTLEDNSGTITSDEGDPCQT